MFDLFDIVLTLVEVGSERALVFLEPPVEALEELGTRPIVGVPESE